MMYLLTAVSRNASVPHGPRAQTRPGRYRLTMAGPLLPGHGTASPARPPPRPGPCTRTRTGRCRGHPADPTPPAGRELHPRVIPQESGLAARFLRDREWRPGCAGRASGASRAGGAGGGVRRVLGPEHAGARRGWLSHSPLGSCQGRFQVGSDLGHHLLGATGPRLPAALAASGAAQKFVERGSCCLQGTGRGDCSRSVSARNQQPVTVAASGQSAAVAAHVG